MASKTTALAPSPPFSSVQLMYLLIGTEFALSTLLALAFGFRTTEPVSFLPQLWCVGLVACGPLARYINHPKLATATETVGLVYGQGIALYALLYPLTAIAAPFADANLDAADRALGFDWPAFAHYVAAHQWLLNTLIAGYFSFMVQGAFLLPLLVYRGLSERVWQMILGLNIALILCILIYPLVPAAGTFVHYGIAMGDYPFIPFRVPWSFAPVIEAIRDNGERLIDRHLLTSFVSFPSYHASSALLFAWAAWPLRWLRWPMLALNALMALSALIVGGHYLVDLIGGLAVGVVALALATQIAIRLR